MSGGDKTIQAKHIGDVKMLEALDRASIDVGGIPRPTKVATLDRVERELAPIPPKVVLAKLRSLIKRKIIDGCGCGCRGDFEVINDPRFN